MRKWVTWVYSPQQRIGSWLSSYRDLQVSMQGWKWLEERDLKLSNECGPACDLPGHGLYDISVSTNPANHGWLALGNRTTLVLICIMTLLNI